MKKLKLLTLLLLVLFSMTLIPLIKSHYPAANQLVTLSRPNGEIPEQHLASEKATEIPSPAKTITAEVASTTTTNQTTTDEAEAPTLTAHHVQLQAIPAISQLPELPNGCEAVAATMLLNWAGLPITKAEVADALPKGDMPYENEDGAFVGSNPKDVFVGDPFDVGYGIYHAPVAKLMNQWLPGHIRDLTGTTFDDLLEVIAHGSPAMIWATEHMDTPYLDLEWEDEAGELVPWYQPEHTLLLTGWDDDYAYMNDPMTGEQETYSLAAFKEAWELMGSQAITIIT
ncbi:C39 family peptidase [Paenibacillus qinlingensis]|uniref:Uncharacterized protein YvpB n=1 Tax=Paenibacillus qinlingensis TaxID=1837343 RepID=A0ABU1NX73_9BACL|nr:C39 family peptidase [Paenibacillus qinlingensis]MDR6552087.1 uncharacterized protein YvpB [Paenibacillus qinlingensis]